jgi:poly(3-hydroxybutyrate) depolymerase
MRGPVPRTTRAEVSCLRAESIDLPKESWMQQLRATAMAAALAVALAGCGDSASVEPVPSLRVDASRVTVSGMSSGAYMAHQVHLALNDRITGAALFAGGPYACAGGDLERALAECMAPEGTGPDVEALATVALERAAAGTIAAIADLSGDRVFVFHGALDTTVGANVTRASESLYRALDPTLAIEADFDRAVAHTFPTPSAGAACDKAESPFLGACGIDGAGLAFRGLGLVDASVMPADAPAGEWREFNQAALAAEDAPSHLDPTGLLYVPPGCADGGCGLHVVFHGCEQSLGKIGRVFAEGSGFARWAGAARVVVAFPQARASFMPLNPKACWDWWGYSGPTYDTRDGAQIRVIANLIDALAARS